MFLLHGLSGRYKPECYNINRITICLRRTRKIACGSLNTPKKIVDAVRKIIGCDPNVEEFYVLVLDPTLRLLGYRRIARGTVDTSYVPIDQIALLVLTLNGTGVVTIHNHPSGNLKVSKEDTEIASRIKTLLELLGKKYIDNIILGLRGKYLSFTEDGIMHSIPGEVPKVTRAL